MICLFLFHDEAAFYYLYLKFYMENDKEGVFEFIKRDKLDVKNNHLLTYLAVNLRINNQQSARPNISCWNEIQVPEYLSTSAWDLEMGYIAISHLDPDAAIYFEKFIQAFRGRFYLKDALQKIKLALLPAGRSGTGRILQESDSFKRSYGYRCRSTGLERSP